MGNPKIKPRKKVIRKPIKRKQAKKRKEIKRDLDPNVRRCIVDEIAVSKGTRKLSKGQKRALFDSALRKCLRQTH